LINVLLAEDHNIVRNGIKFLLDSEASIQVMGEAANGKEAIRILEDNPEISLIVADLNMPGMTGVELIQYLSANFGNVKIVVLSMSDHDNCVSEAFNAGAQGYLLKNISRDELIFALKHVTAGGKYICCELSQRMFAKITSNEIAQAEFAGFVDFTKRELEVLKFIADGYTNNEIADKLFTSRRTVEGHRQSLIDKTGVSNSAALITHAFRSGIIK
jgi:DNA-binding NarL/FixJ family response regulator